MQPERLIAIGDIHGELERLNLLLDWVTPTARDLFVFLGDSIDRGPHSCGVIERLMAFGLEFPQTVFLRGNHEHMLLDAWVESQKQNPMKKPGLRLYDSALDMFLANGGRQTLRSYGLSRLEDMPKTHLEFIKATRLWWQHDHSIFVHAGVAQGTPVDQQDAFTLLMDRHCPAGENGIIHVVGHTPTLDGEPHFEPGRYNLDTGAVYGRNLTACDVLTRSIWQI